MAVVIQEAISPVMAAVTPVAEAAIGEVILGEAILAATVADGTVAEAGVVAAGTATKIRTSPQGSPLPQSPPRSSPTIIIITTIAGGSITTASATDSANDVAGAHIQEVHRESAGKLKSLGQTGARAFYV